MKIKAITIKDIENFHPENLHCESDFYFAELARKILSALIRNQLIKNNFSEYLRDFSLKLALYFEDVISGLKLFFSAAIV